MLSNAQEKFPNLVPWEPLIVSKTTHSLTRYSGFFPGPLPLLRPLPLLEPHPLFGPLPVFGALSLSGVSSLFLLNQLLSLVLKRDVWGFGS